VEAARGVAKRKQPKRYARPVAIPQSKLVVSSAKRTKVAKAIVPEKVAPALIPLIPGFRHF